MRFHGISPAQARESGANLRSFAPLHIKITMEGGNMLDYRIVDKAPFTVVGIKKTVQCRDKLQGSPGILGRVDVRHEGAEGHVRRMLGYGRKDL